MRSIRYFRNKNGITIMNAGLYTHRYNLGGVGHGVRSQKTQEGCTSIPPVVFFLTKKGFKMDFDYGYRQIEKEQDEFFLKSLWLESLGRPEKKLEIHGGGKLPALPDLIKKFLQSDDVKCKEDEFIKQKECSTCLNPILLGQKTHIDRSGVERHKGCAMGFYK
jgi:hypothetical protein